MATLYPILHNMLPLVIVTLVVWAVMHARQQPLWAEAYRRLAHNPLALMALGIICLYGVIAVLDSLRWSDAQIRGTEDRAWIACLHRCRRSGRIPRLWPR